MNIALVWFLFIAGPMTNGDLQVEGGYATEKGCMIQQEQKTAKGWTYAKCLSLPANLYVRNSK